MRDSSASDVATRVIPTVSRPREPNRSLSLPAIGAVAMISTVIGRKRTPV